MARVAVLGTGAMGSRMAARLLQAGHGVTVWNRSRERTQPLVEAGAQAAATPRAAVEAIEVAIAMVRDDAASHAVWLDPEDGALCGLTDGAIAVESSTLSLDGIRKLALHFQRRQIAFLDAPVTGSRPQAEAGQLIYLVGGEAEALRQVEPILRAMGSTVHHTGAVGSAVAIKLAVNALLGIQAVAVAELITLLGRSGFEQKRAAEIIAANPVCSPSAKAALTAMLAGQFAPLFPIELVEKDIGYALQAAAAAELNLPLVEAARRVYSSALAQGAGEQNITGVINLYR